jgi:hypothetical protein
MATKDLRALLAEIIRQQAGSGPLPSFNQNTLIANAVLSPYVQAQGSVPTTEDIRGPSFVNRILDIASRPLYGVQNMAKTALEQGHRRNLDNRTLLEGIAEAPVETAKAFYRGVSGKDKTLGSDVVREYSDVFDTDIPKPVQAGLGFGLDVAADPLTYVGLGIAGNIGRGATRSVQALRGVEEAGDVTARSLTEDIARRAAQTASQQPPGIPSSVAPLPTIPSKGQLQEPARLFQAGPAPVNVYKGQAPDLSRPAITASSHIDEITTLPEHMPSMAVVDTADTIAAPVARANSMRDLIEEVSGQGINWRKLTKKQLSSMPDDPDALTAITFLKAQAASNKSPVLKNMINKQIEKLREGVTPANLIQSARYPPKFPKSSLTESRTVTATNIGNSFAGASKFDEINHVGQTNLYNRIVTWANKQKGISLTDKPSVIFHMLRTAEEAILKTGKRLVDSEGYSVRLSDVANLAGGSRALRTKLVDDFRKAKPSQVVEDLKAGNENVIAQQLLDPLFKTASQAAKDTLASGAPPSRTIQLGSDLSRALEQIAKEAGASSIEAKSAREFMKDFFNPHRDALYDDVMKEARNLLRRTVTGKYNSQMTHRINGYVYDALRANPRVLGKDIPQNRVVEAIMLRFATWWNAKDLRPFAREYIDTARNIAAAFERSMTPIVRGTTASQRLSAWRIAQGHISAGTPSEAALAQQFQYLVERLIGAHGLSNTKALAESVLVRGGITLKEINKELPGNLRFLDTKGADKLGRAFDYTEENWMHSWKEWNVKDPSEAIYQLTRSLQLATRKVAMLDDAAARWGLPTKTGEFRHPVSIDRLQGFYFPKQIADQLNAVWKQLETDKFHYGGPALQIFDKVQRMWKTGVTIYSPSHHIRNLNGDIFLSTLDGVITTTPYKKSLEVLHAFNSRYKDIENVLNIMDPALRDAALRARPGKVLVTTRSGLKMTTEQVYQAAENQGFLLRAATLEDLLGGEAAFGTFGQKFAPFGGRVHQTAAKASELRDHFVRLAHFIDVLGKSRSKTLKEAIEIAGRRVKKFHPDGSDLTGFEQSVMRRIIPFYSWLRKATPLVLEGAVMRPHISLAFPKAMSNLQTLTGIESEGPGNPFPVDQMFPDWIKEKGVGPVIPPDHPLAGIGRQQTWRGDAPGYVIINPTNPLIDQLTQIGKPKQSLLSGLTPAARIPIELLTGRTALDIPLEEVEGGVAGHLLQQVPPVGIGARITGQTRPDEPYHPEQLTNWLVSGGLITGTGPYKGQAQFEIRELLQRMGKEERERLK